MLVNKSLLDASLILVWTSIEIQRRSDRRGGYQNETDSSLCVHGLCDVGCYYPGNTRSRRGTNGHHHPRQSTVLPATISISLSARCRLRLPGVLRRWIRRLRWLLRRRVRWLLRGRVRGGVRWEGHRWVSGRRNVG